MEQDEPQEASPEEMSWCCVLTLLSCSSAPPASQKQGNSKKGWKCSLRGLGAGGAAAGREGSKEGEGFAQIKAGPSQEGHPLQDQ